MKEQLTILLDKLENNEGNSQTLGYEALSVIQSILEENPLDIDARVARMRLNTDWVFSNSQEIIEDASFIIENEQFGQDKLVGYHWLTWVYEELLVLPDKAIEVIEEQLVEIQSLIKETYKKNKIEGELLNRLASIHYNNEQVEKALSIWGKSYDKNVYLFERNAIVGMLFLDRKEFEKATKFLLTHYSWSYNFEDGYRLQYGIKLKELYDQKELDEYPDLIGMLYNIFRNEAEQFGTTGTLDFYEKHFPKLEKWQEKYPDNSLIQTAIANTYSGDLKDYDKAYDAYYKLFECDKNIHFVNLSRIHKTAKKSSKDFFDFPFKFEGYSHDMYNHLTTLNEYTDKTDKKKKKKKYTKLAIKYGEVGYKQYRDYILNGKGDSHNDYPHEFAMLCNNYANALGDYADLFLKKEEKHAMQKKAGEIHIEGYQISPFIENLENASRKYFDAKDYHNSIKYSLQCIHDFKDELELEDYQNLYWKIVRSYIKLDNIEEAENYYYKAKELLSKVGKGSKGASDFLFMSKLFYAFVVKKKAYEKYIAEMEWFLSTKIATQQKEPLEQGLISFYLGVCYFETTQKEKAIQAFHTATSYLKDADWDFYDTKYDEAENYLLELGEKLKKENRQDYELEKNSKKSKSIFQKIKSAIMAPFVIFGIIGGIVYMALQQNKKGQKKKSKD